MAMVGCLGMLEAVGGGIFTKQALEARPTLKAANTMYNLHTPCLSKQLVDF